MAGLTLTVIGKAMFSTDMGADVQSMLEASVDATFYVNQRLASIIDPPLWLPTAANRRFNKAIRTFDQVIYRFIDASAVTTANCPTCLAAFLRLRTRKLTHR